uniref:General transcription and DNA repair factor IIH subunit TFB5 n=1 Tax=Odontella aurita TaxID=265563 RepID=A0A7S4JQJ4_9STRA|mmetsp:Transcript_51640/g.155018  ORF Transcript_51640/g.155018 Transcript_51640/m.155018 type:complete len:114 (+) Transcript_51640:288-629(+)|eukprot:CAMPEP_0113600138 /NCGR_PEP_ID=MMETSP0015_2-20120614/42544_1 /TAXON_ID=2838 /ORGANISM="Odontella" /LENGTH=113 /DNA_ID=CAMNT_0000508369 /DNA_START=246 /DNA_END=587 /DNA_ORIENTATION=+ /assembly_acc=CAM_ASM_000160
MPSKDPSKKKKSRTKSSNRSGASSSSAGSASSGSAPALPSSGYLLTCDPPAKQFIRHLNETKSIDKKFIIEDLDATHLLIDGKARGEIMRKVEQWMDENVFTNVDRVGENLET